MIYGDSSIKRRNCNSSTDDKKTLDSEDTLSIGEGTQGEVGHRCREQSRFSFNTLLAE